ncbi:MAG TPA: hypothetical protein VKI61_20050 [Chitinophagaceae bacterium]|nr:hypothetical protein [Chitinophagaceae bacterium]
MNKIMIACIAFGFAMSSCNSNDNLVQFRALSENLQTSSLLIKNENEKIYHEMEDKLKDPHTLSRAKFWQPKAMEVKKFSSDMKDYIDKLTSNLKNNAALTTDSSKEMFNEADKKSVSLLFNEQGKSVELYQKLVAFKKSLTGVIKPDEFSDNPMVQRDLVSYGERMKTFVIPDIATNSKKDNTSKTNAIVNYFQNITVICALTILNKEQNDILSAENAMLNYFNSMTVSNYDGFTQYLPLISQNNTYFEAGQLLEIKAGVGAFSSAAKPNIYINGIRIPINTEGVSIYKLRIGNKPGKHSITVTIKFIRPNGTSATVYKNINYIVAE